MGTERRTRVGAARSVSRRAAGGRWAGSWRRRGGGRCCPHPSAKVRTCRQTRGHTARARGTRWRGWRLCQRASEPLFASWWCGRGGGGGRYDVASASLPARPHSGGCAIIFTGGNDGPSEPPIGRGQIQPQGRRVPARERPRRSRSTGAPLGRWTRWRAPCAVCNSVAASDGLWCRAKEQPHTNRASSAGARLSLGGGGQGFNRERWDPRARASTLWPSALWPCSVCAVERSCLWTAGRPPPPGRLARCAPAPRVAEGRSVCLEEGMHRPPPPTSPATWCPPHETTTARNRVLVHDAPASPADPSLTPSLAYSPFECA